MKEMSTVEYDKGWETKWDDAKNMAPCHAIFVVISSF